MAAISTVPKSVPKSVPPHRLVVDEEPAAAAITAVGAFAALIFRYTRETMVTIDVDERASSGPSRLQIAVGADTDLASLRARVEDAFRGTTEGPPSGANDLMITWSELSSDAPLAVRDGAFVALATRLRDLRVDIVNSMHRDLVHGVDSLQRIEHHFRAIALAMRTRPNDRVCDVAILDSRERRMLRAWCHGDVLPELATPGLLHQLFEARAFAVPDQIAVICRDEQLTYGELDERADRLAHALRLRGLGPGASVAFQLPRSLDVYVAILGILKSGAAYVPLDPEFPRDRVEYIVQDSGAALLLTHSTSAASLRGLPCTIVALDADWTRFVPDDRPLLATREPCPSDVAYVIYTSGSTGRPKGVAVEHRNVHHLVRAEQRLFEVRPRDRVFQGLSVAFDAAVEEVWLAFAAGATLVAGTKDVILADLADYLTETGVTILSTVPTLLSTLHGELPSVRLLIVGGEACPPDLVARWATDERTMVNTYGPTEATVIATSGRLLPDRPVTIGTPIPNYDTFILDAEGAMVPPGVAGEICIAGVGLARGYVGNPQLTASRFVRARVEGEGDAPIRIYRTGDRGRFDGSGNIEFLGRLDDQVKLRGYRIELGEIEGALLATEMLAQALVTVREDTPGVKQLVAYVVGRDGVSPSGDELKAKLRSRLPAYMIPSHVTVLDALPTLTSGKVDKGSLPAPRISIHNATETELEQPRNALEQKIAACWAKLFGVPRVGCRQDFFLELGGHSLLAAQMVSALRKEPTLATLSVLDVYQRPTVALLAAGFAKPQAPSPVDATGQFVAASLASMLAAAPRPATDPVSAQRRYRWCAVAQGLALHSVFGLHSLQWLAPYLAYVVLRHAGAPLGVALFATAATLFAVYPAMMLVALAAKWLVIGRYKAGRYPLWGAYYFRWWLVDRMLQLAPTDFLVGTPLLAVWYRLLGAKVGKDVFLGADSMQCFDLVSIGDDTSVGEAASLGGASVEDGMLILGPVKIGARCMIGTRGILTDDVELHDDATLGDVSMLPRGTRIPAGQHWAGSPARPAVPPVRSAPAPKPTARTRAAFLVAYVACVLAMPAFLVGAMLPGLIGLTWLHRAWGGHAYVVAAPLAALAFIVVVCAEIVALKKLLLGRVEAGKYPVWSGFYLRNWIFDQALGVSMSAIGGLFATLFLNPWYRLLGVHLGENAEMSTAAAVAPDLLHVGDEAFIADDVSLGSPRLDRGWLHLEPTYVGKGTFVGNSATVPAGTTLGEGCLVGALSLAPNEPLAKGKAWFGSPPIELPQRQVSAAFSREATYAPTRALVARRMAHEVVRILLPTTVAIGLTCLLIDAAVALHESLSLFALLLVFPALMLGFGVLAAAIVVAMKWALIGRYRPGDVPLWSAFVWRNEIVTAMHENVADPFFNELLEGTPFAAWFYRALGAKIGKRAYLSTTCFTEYDLVDIGDDVTLDVDCTIQTHLFEDRVLKMSGIKIGDRCSVGADAVVLYDAEMETGSSLGPLSLLMKGETLPAGSHWEGSPATAVRRARRIPSRNVGEGSA